MADPEKHEGQEGTELEKAAAGHAADVLILAAKAGVRPDAAKMAELMSLWGADEKAEMSVEEPSVAVEGIAKVAAVEHAAVKAAVPTAIETGPNLKAKVDELIRRCSVGGGTIGRGQLDDIMKELGLENDIETGELVVQSLEQSLKKNVNIKIIAQKLSILHNFPSEVGGGGFTGMGAAPKLKVALLRKLLKELSRYSVDAQQYPFFRYSFSRALEPIGAWTDGRLRIKDLDPRLQGNARSKAIIEMVLATDLKDFVA